MLVVCSSFILRGCQVCGSYSYSITWCRWYDSWFPVIDPCSLLKAGSSSLMEVINLALPGVVVPVGEFTWWGAVTLGHAKWHAHICIFYDIGYIFISTKLFWLKSKISNRFVIFIFWNLKLKFGHCCRKIMTKFCCWKISRKILF